MLLGGVGGADNANRVRDGGWKACHWSGGWWSLLKLAPKFFKISRLRSLMALKLATLVSIETKLLLTASNSNFLTS